MLAGLTGKVLPVLGLLCHEKRAGPTTSGRKDPAASTCKGTIQLEITCFVLFTEHRTERVVRCHDTRRLGRSEALHPIIVTLQHDASDFLFPVTRYLSKTGLSLSLSHEASIAGCGQFGHGCACLKK